jgi:hypothetical protein
VEPKGEKMKLKELDIGKFFIFSADKSMKDPPVYKYCGYFLLGLSDSSGLTTIDDNEVAQKLYEHEVIEINIPFEQLIAAAIK